MIFTIERSSMSAKDRPCEEAFRLREGLGRLHWAVRIESLEELAAFTKKYGKCILDIYDLEIYDYYRE